MAKNYIEDHKKGTTWDGLSIKFEEENDLAINPNGPPFIPVNLTGVSVLIRFRDKFNSSVIFDFKTANNTVTIPDPLSGELFMMPRKMDVPECNYWFDVELTFPNQRVEEPISSYWTIY